VKPDLDQVLAAMIRNFVLKKKITILTWEFVLQSDGDQSGDQGMRHPMAVLYTTCDGCISKTAVKYQRIAAGLEWKSAYVRRDIHRHPTR